MISEALRLARDVLIKPFEGYHKKLPDGGCTAYPDPGSGDKPWTIGWGSTHGVKPGDIWTEAKAEQELDKELALCAAGLLKYSPGLIRALDRRFAALNSFAFNCGLGNYRISTLRKRVNEEDWEGAAEEILKWNKAAGRVMRGLTRRRKAEAVLLDT